MSYLASVTHDIKSNTLEATWLELVGEELKRVKSRNYSQEQKASLKQMLKTAPSTLHWLTGKRNRLWH